MERDARIWTPFWWGCGPDGWPLVAIPLGGSEEPGPGSLNDPGKLRPVTYLLEASTGRERHEIDGLAGARVADLDGDGVGDLWGDVGGELRVFRGEAPEAWRALGLLGPARAEDDSGEPAGTMAVDLDGDGITDALARELHGPSYWDGEKSGSRTAVARSGRDGHVIWKRTLDGWESWLAPDGGDVYSLGAFPLPEGDFDGDGTPDVIVIHSDMNSSTAAAIPAARLPVQVLSGRTGAKLWSCGSLPSGSAGTDDRVRLVGRAAKGRAGALRPI